MTQTLKITLPSSLNAGVDYLKLGEMRIKITTIIEGAFIRMTLRIAEGMPTSVSILGDTTSQFLDTAGTTALGKTVNLTTGSNDLYFKANGIFYISISNKFSVLEFGRAFSLFSMATEPGFLVPITGYITPEVELGDMKYVEYTRISGTNTFCGDISSVNKTLLTYFEAPNPNSAKKITGVISSSTFNYAQLTRLVLNRNSITGSIQGAAFTIATHLGFENMDIAGTITSLSAGIVQLNLLNTDIVLNLSVLNGKTSFTTLLLEGSLAFGDVSNLSSLTIRELSSLKGLNLTGDISRLNNQTVFVSNTNQATTTKNKNANLSTTHWTAKRADRQYILATERVRLTTGVDQFLIDMSGLDLHPSSVSGPLWLRTISILGTRTAASDAAVSTLASKGVTVIISNS